MLLLAIPVLAFQVVVQTGVKRSAADSLLQDSLRMRSLPDSTRRRLERDLRELRRSEQHVRDSVRALAPKRIPLTPELLASAFRDPAARTLLERARVARLHQDSTLLSYDAIAHQRISAGLGLKLLGRKRLIFRHETAARVRWKRGVGAAVDLLGRRTVIPIAPKALAGDPDADDPDLDAPIPYYPGQDQLWAGSGLAKEQVDEREIVHPLAVGAEAYYTYRTGDSAGIALPDGEQIRLRELRIEARRPQWNLIVGSFWFDVSTAQLVRAVYRLSVPMDIVAVAAQEDSAEGNGDDDDIPRWLRPMTATVRSITVEYGLYQGEHGGHWWLPRLQAFDGEAQVSFAHVPVSLEESFTYQSVNGLDSLPSYATATMARDSARAVADSIFRADTLSTATTEADSAKLRHARRDAMPRRVDEGDAYVRSGRRFDGTVRVVQRVPKDTAALAHSPELPPSIYDPGEEIFGDAERAELVKSLDGLYPGLVPTSPEIHYGLEDGLLRYNRVEGLSAGVAVDQHFGNGLSGRVTGRIGTGDWTPNGEIAATRSDGTHTLTLAGYHRLATANDWGDPLGVGASLSSFLFARDEGFYYRTLGGELRGSRVRDHGVLDWRLFAEQQRAAHVETQFSLPHLFSDSHGFIENIDAAPAAAYGFAGRLHDSRGLDPHGWRSLLDIRAEAATGTFDYTRGSADLTVSHGLGQYLDGALTASAGTSGGRLPVQRFWYLGGSQSVRGQSPAPVGAPFAGDAYWMARAELGYSLVAARPVIFYDAGWAGSRSDWSHPGRPMSGAGVGASFLDGLIRFDLAKGIWPGTGWRSDLYLESRF